jgi:hypothetical protein
VEERWRDEKRGLEIPNRVEPCIPLARRTPFVVNAFHSTTLDTFRYEPWTVHENTTRYLAGATGVSDYIRRAHESDARVPQLMGARLG